MVNTPPPNSPTLKVQSALESQPSATAPIPANPLSLTILHILIHQGPKHESVLVELLECHKSEHIKTCITELLLVGSVVQDPDNRYRALTLAEYKC